MPLLATEEGCRTSKDPEIVYWDNYLNNEKEIIAPDQIVIQERTLDASDLDNFSWLVPLPTVSWKWSFFQSTLVCSSTIKTDKGSFITKSVEVASRKNVVLHMGGKKLSIKTIKCNFSNFVELGTRIQEFDSLNPCQGLNNTSAADKRLFTRVFKIGTIDHDGQLRSISCEVYAEANLICKRCQKLKDNFSKIVVIVSNFGIKIVNSYVFIYFTL